MSKSIQLDGLTIGELRGMYRVYQRVYTHILNTHQKHLLGQVIKTLAEINEASRIINEKAISYINKGGSPFLPKNEADFYSEMVIDWDVARCKRALDLIEDKVSPCRSAIVNHMQMMELLND